MYERFQSDPGSVDDAWVDFFRTRGTPGGANGAATSDRAGDRAGERADDRAGERAGDATRRPTTAPRDPAPAPAAAAKAETRMPTADDSPRTAAAVTRTTGVAKAVAPTVPAVTRADGPPAKTGPAPVPKEKSPSAPANASDEPTVSPLRGAPARTAQNMDLSRSVPTATSVRSIPVKLLWDNRIVINNHLARARGGKVSFTHLIGYALVRALREMPDMNHTYAEVDGKPNLVVPAHINLGQPIGRAHV